MPLRVVQREGRPHLYLRGTVRGQSIFESAGTGDPKAAEQIRIKREAELLEESIHGKKINVLWEQAVDSYIAAGGPTRFLADVSAKGKVSGLAIHLRGRKMRSLGQADLDAAAVELYPNASPETRNRQCYTPFIAVWNHAVVRGWADKKEWSRPRKPKGTNVRSLKKRAGTFPVDYAVGAEFVAKMSPAPAYVMTTLFYTGMRPIELFALDFDQGDINVGGRWIVIQGSKTGEPRGIPMHEFLVPLFEALAKRGGRVFRTPRGEPYPIIDDGGGQLKTAIIGARRRSGHHGVAPYTGRHSCSTQLVVNKVHPYLKDQILGHVADDMSRHYTNIPQAPLIEAINTLAVPQGWRDLPWWADPVGWNRKLAEGTGARNDLKKRTA